MILGCVILDDVVFSCVILVCVILGCVILVCVIMGCVLLDDVVFSCVILECVILGCVILGCVNVGCVSWGGGRWEVSVCVCETSFWRCLVKTRTPTLGVGEKTYPLTPVLPFLNWAERSGAILKIGWVGSSRYRPPPQRDGYKRME